MRITSPAFRDEEHIPRQYTRDGEDKNPPLRIEDVPVNTSSLVLIMDDPDAPRGTFTHWVLFDLDPKTEEIAKGHLPPKARQGATDWGGVGYGGPKPPSGEHRYFFRLYALDEVINLPRGASRQEIENAMRDHIIDTAELMGRYAAPVPAGAG
jgi:Raf kinase inhibitor-like YbhB/YbcL family protein